MYIQPRKKWYCTHWSWSSQCTSHRVPTSLFLLQSRGAPRPHHSPSPGEAWQTSTFGTALGCPACGGPGDQAATANSGGIQLFQPRPDGCIMLCNFRAQRLPIKVTTMAGFNWSCARIFSFAGLLREVLAVGRSKGWYICTLSIGTHQILVYPCMLIITLEGNLA